MLYQNTRACTAAFRRLPLLVIIVLSCLCCKTDKPLEANLRIKPLVGVWKLREVQIIDSQGKLWQEVPYHAENNIEIRPDGVILDYKHEGVCCHPKELTINGSIEPINNFIKIPENSDCSISCIRCQVWTIAYIEGELTLTGCLDTDVRKYKR